MAIPVSADRIRQVLQQQGVTLTDAELEQVSSRVGEQFTRRTIVRETGAEPPPLVMTWTTISHGGEDAGRVERISNYRLDPRGLLKLGLDTTLTVTGLALAQPWLWAVAGLSVAMDLQGMSGRDISERDASVLWALWVSENAESPFEDLHSAVNQLRALHGRVSLSPQEIDSSLKVLQSLRVVKRSPESPLGWCISDTVVIKP